MDHKLFLKFFLIFLYLLFINCDAQERIKITLKKTDKEKIAFDQIFSDFPLLYLKNTYPKYYAFEVSKYKNIPKSDHAYLVTYFIDGKGFLYELYKLNLINKENFIRRSKRINLDTIKESKKKKVDKLVGIVGYKNQKQFLIIDENNNKDFKDDKIVFFDKENNNSGKYSEKKIDSLADINFVYKWKEKLYHRKIKFFPYSSYYQFQRIKDTIARGLGIVGRYQDYWCGSFNIDDKGYNVAIQGSTKTNANILIKEKALNFSKTDENYNYNYSYRLKDTIIFSQSKSYILDSLNQDLHLKRIYIENKLFKGRRIGEILENFKLINLDNKNFTISKNDKYTLLSFWATWCKPCKELKPKLKNIYNNYSKSLNIIGFSYDTNIEEVKEYVRENEIKWTQVFDEKNHISKKLEITFFPTFILLNNNNNKIIYRGGGEKSLKKIEQIIKKQYPFAKGRHKP